MGLKDFFCSALLIYGGFLFAQDQTLQQTIDRSAVEYLNAINDVSVLYYGNVQEDHPLTTNHPYLGDVYYTKARLSYHGVVYPEAMLRLDLKRHELVVLSPDARNIVLFPENVDEAELHGQRVIYFRRDSLRGSPSSGYYYLLHSGNCKVLERQNASLNRKNNNSNILEEYYIFDIRFYLLKDDVYHIIRTKRGLLQILQPCKKELKRFISENHLSFRKNRREEFLVKTIVEYERLTGLQ